MKIRTRYDEKGRISSKAVTDDSGINSKYTYTYRNPDDKEPCRINKNSGGNAILIMQKDENGRLMYSVDEENNLISKYYYGKTGKEMLDLVDDIENIFGSMGDCKFDAVIQYYDENPVSAINPVSVIITNIAAGDFLSFAGECEYDFLRAVYDNAHIDSEDFIEIKDPKVDKYVINYSLDKDGIVSKTENYISGDNVVIVKRTGRTDGVNDLDFVQEIYSERTDSRNVSVSAKIFASGEIEFEFNELRVDEEYPVIPMDANIYNRRILFDKGYKIKETHRVDTTIRPRKINGSDSGQFEHITKFTSTDNSSYEIYRIVDENGQVVHVSNSKTGELSWFQYNDQGLMIAAETEISSNEPKKILYKGMKNPKAAQQQPQKEIHHWNYTEDGRPILVTAHNDLFCLFEAFEYDDEGREIFRATFTSLN